MADLLGSILRRSRIRPYLPFTEPRFRGSYPLPKPRRVFTLNTNPLSLSVFHPNHLNRLSLANPLKLYEDRRLWHPEGANALPRSKVQFRTRLLEVPPNFEGDDVYNPRTGELIYTKSSQLSQKTFSPWKMGFDNPWKTIICLKRKIRREVLMALGYQGAISTKKPRWTQFSYVRCF